MLLLVHHEGRGNEKSWCSYHACPSNLITCILHAGIFHGNPTTRLETSCRHEFTIFQHDFLSYPTRYKSWMLDTFSSRRTRPELCLQFHLPLQFVHNFPPCAFIRYIAHRLNTGHSMVTSRSVRKGAQSIRIASSEPQNDWKSFSPIVAIPKDVKRAIILPTEKTRSNHAESEMKGFTQERNIVGAPYPQQKMPQKRGRLRKNKETMEAHFYKSRAPDR
jgi:hypothetical protein